MTCPEAEEGQGGECRQEGVVYLITCLKCKEWGKRTEYWGETARTGFERGNEHLAGLKGKYQKNSLWKHSELYHEGNLGGGDFKMEIKEKHRSPLTRQIHEGVELETNGASIIMNSKSEWNHCRIPRVVVEVGEEIEEDKESGMIKSTELGGRERGKKSIKIRETEKRGGVHNHPDQSVKKKKWTRLEKTEKS